MESEQDARTYVTAQIGPNADEVLPRLDLLVEALKLENEQQNLVSRGSLDHIWVRHIADSAQLLDHVPRETLRGHGKAKAWLDLGAGAGFPGLVIAAILPDCPVVLVESRAKRVLWLERMIAEMGLANCRVEGQRLELVQTFPACVISARAFAPLEKLLKLSARFSTSGTHWVLPKGRKAAHEVSQLPKSLRKMFHVEQSETSNEAGIVVGRGKITKV